MPSLLSQKAVLASLSISQWSARKLDKKVTEEIHARNHAEPHAGRYNKLLIAREGLQKVQHAAGEARTFHYAMTQPWMDDGARLLPSALFIDYANRIRDLRFGVKLAPHSLQTRAWCTTPRRRRFASRAQCSEQQRW